jgi:hypothetical protein
MEPLLLLGKIHLKDETGTGFPIEYSPKVVECSQFHFREVYGFPTLFAQNGEHGLLQLLR